MTPGFKGTLWIAFIVALFGVAMKVKAQIAPYPQQATGEPRRTQMQMEPKPKIDIEGLNVIFKGKNLVYQGSCWFDKKGILTFKREELKDAYPCMVFMQADDLTKHYVLYNDGKYGRVVVFDEKTKTQERLWSSEPKA